MNMEFERKLTIPMEIKKLHPLTPGIIKTFQRRDEELKRILSGIDNRFVLIIGPCSADKENSVMDYLFRLKKVEEKVCDKLFIIPRIYTSKPRTMSFGYMGMIHQPDPDRKADMLKGIVAARELHIKAVKETELTCADELLYAENYRYFDDLIGYVAIGARSVENQSHRLTASGIDVPVGMKNPRSGDITVMINAAYAAQQKQTFIYRGWEVHSNGNPFAHLILRGYSDLAGNDISNYGRETLDLIMLEYEKLKLSNPAVIIDTNHSNSGRNPQKQPEIAFKIVNARNSDNSVKQLVKGLMVESYIEDGCQPLNGKCYGKSVTDPCLGWKKTEKMILELADKL